MSKRYYVEVEYSVTERVLVNGNNTQEAEDKALQWVKAGLTARDIVSDKADEAEVVRSRKL